MKYEPRQVNKSDLIRIAAALGLAVSKKEKSVDAALGGWVVKPHLGAMPPGLPHGEIEDCHDCGVWWYTVPTRSGDTRRWAFALREDSAVGTIWLVSQCVGNFLTREDAIRAGTDAACVAALHGAPRET